MTTEQATNDTAGSGELRTSLRAVVLRKAAQAAHAVLDRETILVTLMTLTVILSAFSVWQATRASEKADDVSVQVRVLQANLTREMSYLQTLVDHDTNVLRAYCAALVERDVAVATLVTSSPDVRGVVATDLGLRSLRPLLRGDVPDDPCPLVPPDPDRAEGGYSVLEVQQSGTASASAFELEGGETTAASLTSLTAAAASLGSQERWLMIAGLIFTVALLGLIMIDLLGERSKRPSGLSEATVRRSQYASLGVAIAAGLLGGVLLAVKCDLAQLAGILVVLALVVFARRKAAVPGRIRRLLTMRRPLRGEPHWWAEILGALTLVIFSATALSLSHLTVQERTARTQSEREHTVAQQLLQSAEQDALRDLAAVAQLAILDADLAAANQVRPDDAEAISARRAVVAERISTLEGSVRQQRDQLTTSGPKDACAIDDDVMTRSADDLLEEGRERPAVFAEYVYAHQQEARTCDILSALTRTEAVGWASRASTLTLALVILGLSGFLLALASDPDRSRPNARWLLWAGGFGMLLGGAVAMLVSFGVGSARGPGTDADRVAFARDVAAGRHVACDEATDDLNRAIDRFDGYGPAYSARATASFCSTATMPAGSALSSEITDDAVPQITADLRDAVRLGPATPGITGRLGWSLILSGLREKSPSEADLLEGLHLSRQAVEALEANSSSTLTIHHMRINVALAHAALGEREAAVAAYERAMHCLEPAHDCPGGGLLDADVRAEEALWALADLELLEDSIPKDSYRDVIMHAVGSGTPIREGWQEAQLDVYPQEVQISLTGETPAAAVIWYYRPDESVAWGVLRAPSLETLHAGQHLNRPIAAAQYLPAGEYRADLYTGGTKVASLPGRRDGGPDSIRSSSSQLGVSVVTPSDWTEQEEIMGVDWNMGPVPASGVAVRRKDGVTPSTEMAEFLRTELDAWLGERFDRSDAGRATPADDQYFLGLGQTVVRSYGDLNVTAAAGFAPYASTSACGGTLIMAVVGGADLDSTVVRSVFDSLVLDEKPLTVPAMTGSHESEHFSVDIPEGWDAVARPSGGTGNRFNALDCATGTNVLINDEPLDGRTVDSEIDATLANFRKPADFPEFTLISRRPLEVPGSTEAAELVFTWRSENGLVRQRQVYATNQSTLVYLTFTTHLINVDDFWQYGDVIIDSLRLLPG